MNDTDQITVSKKRKVDWEGSVTSDFLKLLENKMDSIASNAKLLCKSNC